MERFDLSLNVWQVREMAFRLRLLLGPSPDAKERIGSRREAKGILDTMMELGLVDCSMSMSEAVVYLLTIANVMDGKLETMGVLEEGVVVVRDQGWAYVFRMPNQVREILYEEYERRYEAAEPLVPPQLKQQAAKQGFRV